MKNLAFCVILSLICIYSSAIVPQEPGSVWRMDLNGVWQFYLNESGDIENARDLYKNGEEPEWQEINVPGHLELQGIRMATYGGSGRTSAMAWYKKEFYVPDEWKNTDRQIEIIFEGVAFGYDLWLNGELIGGFESAYNRSSHNISREIKENEKNELLVKVYNKHQHAYFDQSDSWSPTGIFRDVYMNATPLIHIDEFQVNTTISDEKTAIIDVDLDIYSFWFEGEPLEDLKVIAELKKASDQISSQEKEVVWLSGGLPGMNKSNAIMPEQLSFRFQITDPLLWTAETPYLYNLSLSLWHSDKLLQQLNTRVGIREISIVDGQLRLNGKKVKLRGINRHEMHPERGRALTREDWILDLELMKAANINTVRTSHYPPHPGFIELCDSFGMYVIDEVPMGNGDFLLHRPKSLGLLLERVQHTIDRDRNRPSVIMWSIGNENPISRYLIKAGEFAKMLDPSRPIGYAGNNAFDARHYGIPADVDIYCRHYPDTPTIEVFAETDEVKMPIVLTEFNHALDNALDQLETRWKIMQESDNFAGGCIWDWVDQEIVRKVPQGEMIYDPRKETEAYLERNSFRVNRWVNDSTILDTHGADGNDGIVDGYRNPWPSYYEVKSVYAPTKVEEKEIILREDKQVELSLVNHYDFLNLNHVKTTYKLISNRQEIESGEISLNGAPGEKVNFTVPVNENDLKIEDENYLIVTFFDPSGRHINSSHIRLLKEKATDYTAFFGSPLVTSLSFSKESSTPVPGVVEKSKGINVKFNENGSFEISRAREILASGPVLHTNRKLDNTDIFMIYRKAEQGRSHKPFIMDTHYKNAVLVSSGLQETGKTKKLMLEYEFPLNESGALANLSLVIEGSEENYIDFNYQISASGIEAGFHELGFGLETVADYSHFSWLGDGPHISYPGQSALNEYGYHHKELSARFIEGNYHNVNAGFLNGPAKYGTGIIANFTDLNIEKSSEGLIISQNLYVANRARKMHTSNLMYLDEPMQGAFRFVVCKKNKLPGRFKELIIQ